MNPTITPKERARRSAEAMWAGDNASREMGMELLNVDAGSASIAMTVQPQHTNGHAICHGGITFSLADSTFAFACNAYNRITLAQHNVISYIAPAKLGDRLTATAREVSLRGRNGIYDVEVRNQDDRLIAQFRGFSRAIEGQLFNEEEA